MTDHTSIAARLAAAGRPARPGLADVRQDLVALFGAERAPLDLMTDEDYDNDERVVAGHARELWSITDRQALARLADDDEREQVLPAEEARRDLAEVDSVPEPAERRYARTLIEHGAGLRTSVLLQWAPDDPEQLTAFVDYGVLGTGLLQRYHDARYGVANMHEGDIDDPLWRAYLRALDAEGLV
ncbi:hypothetical protein [Actinotalea sp. K2]|uniref:hypothetical protein n=1 Tax=Actinotalea sp. K2 TaxID=2939438 RepID=UPI002017BC70|nr:hypothetical protein [Actinotalea sp. K2]MCL3861559.1 hypothetical protein [Actinotalea sp. K2]